MRAGLKTILVLAAVLLVSFAADAKKKRKAASAGLSGDTTITHQAIRYLLRAFTGASACVISWQISDSYKCRVQSASANCKCRLHPAPDSTPDLCLPAQVYFDVSIGGESAGQAASLARSAAESASLRRHVQGES